MNEARKKRMVLILLLITGVAGATGLALLGAKPGIDLTVTPTDVIEQQFPAGKRVMIGGLVKTGSVRRAADSLDISFKVTDKFRCVTVHFNKILPDLFKEGESVVARGVIAADGSINADSVLAKHDENYMPPEASAAMEKAKQRSATLASNGQPNADCTP
jgi:cytochrome c-type biogenesis protein CcmE